MRQSTRRDVIRGIAGAGVLGTLGAGTVVADHARAAVTFEDQHAGGARVTVASATLPHGGFVVLHDLGQRGAVIGHSQSLPAGTHEGITIAIRRGQVPPDLRGEDRTLLAMPHRDTGTEGKYEFPDADPPYLDDAPAPVTDTAEISFGPP